MHRVESPVMTDGARALRALRVSPMPLRRCFLFRHPQAARAALLAAGMLGAAHAAAQATQDRPQLAVTSADPTTEEKARDVLTKHCAGCHERGWLWRGMTTVWDKAIDMPALLRHPDAPGEPDASRLYTVMLSDHAHAALTAEAPTPEEIDAVRAWISEAAPLPTSSCARRQVTLADLGRMLDRLRKPGADALKGIRFISLAADYNSCASDADLAVRRTTLRNLLLKLRNGSAVIDLPLAADNLPVLAVRLGDLGWPASRWDALAAQANAPELADAGLADAYGTATPLIDAAALASAANALGHSYVLAGRDGDAPAMLPSLHQDGAVLDLMIAARTDIGLADAAGELGLPPDKLEALLAGLTGSQEGAARALRQGRISRRAWHAVRAQLKLPGEPGPLRYVAGIDAQAANPRLEVHLWSDKRTYRKGDLVVLTAQPNRDCHLNIINIDVGGEATVLFPSDADPDNAVKAGTKVRIPSDIEPYQLRASEVGKETFVAVCALNRKRMLGVDQDFEKQRFSILGNWRQFLLTRATREQLVGRRDTPRRRRARAKADAAAAAAAKEPEREARSAITIAIE